MYKYDFVLNEILDADSLRGHIDLGLKNWIHDVDLRFFAIDAPETRAIGGDKMHKRHGLTAKKYVQDKLKIGKTYKIQTFKDARGKYGRVLTKFYHHGFTKRCLNTELCLLHLAIPYVDSKQERIKAHKDNLKAFLKDGNIPLVEL